MFLYRLKAEQRIPFLVLAKQLIKIDSAITPEEEVLFDLMKKEMNISPDLEISDNCIIADECKHFTERHIKVLVIAELINLGYIDQEYRKEERNFVKLVAKEFQLSDDTIKNCENWVWKKIALFDEVERF